MVGSDAYRLAESLANDLKQVAHPTRVLLLAVLLARGRLKWEELAAEVRRLAGPVSPNALAYHVRALYRSGYLVRHGTPDELQYEAVETAKQIPGMAKVVEAVKRCGV